MGVVLKIAEIVIAGRYCHWGPALSLRVGIVIAGPVLSLRAGIVIAGPDPQSSGGVALDPGC
jgi:hypothetical protein